MFSPAWWLILVASLALSALTLRLGFWQLGRAQYKESLHAQQVAQRARAPLHTADVLQPSDAADHVHRAVQVQGEWVGAATVFLANRTMQGKVGFWVLTPLRLRGDEAVLVVRGWAPRDVISSDRLPPVQTPSGAVQVQGHWEAPPSQMLELAHTTPHSASGFAPLRQNVDLSSLARETGLQLLGTVWQIGPPSEGLWRDWPPILTGADKNRAYALQWFALSALSAGLFIWFQIFRKRRHG